MQEIEAELAALGPQVNRPRVHLAVQGPPALWERRSRRREVCMVVRRPNGKLLTFTKTFYPPGVYRLLTGGVEPGEGVLDALRREVAEETGLDVAIRRLLALIAYRAEGEEDCSPRAFTFAFLLDDLGGTLGAIDPAERLAGYGEVDIPGLLTIADQLDHLPDSFSVDFGESWRDWGAFRAIVHRVVWQAMNEL
ncbi:MAG: NUDIX hydrolase [Chloroflexi bacterium]|nr:NUDIX hydrolase [Chloroflexota bacterium]